MNVSSSPLVQQATVARRRPHLAIVWLVATATIVVGQLVGGVVAEAITGHGVDGSVASQWNQVITNGFTLMLLASWVLIYERRSFWSLGLLDRLGAGRFAAGLLGGMLLFAVPLGLLVLLGQYDDTATGGHTTVGAAAVWIVVSLLPMWFVQSTTEEVVTRGYLLQWHGLKLTNGLLAVLLPSIGFAVVHLDFHPIVLINITLVGLLFSFLSLAQGSIWLAAGVHTGWNMAQGNIFGIPVSGGAYDVTVFTFGPTDGAADVLTGGDFGIEGGLAATVVLVVATSVSYRYYRRTEATRTSTGDGVDVTAQPTEA